MFGHKYHMMLDNVLVFDKRRRNFSSLGSGSLGRDIQSLNFFSLKLRRRFWFRPLACETKYFPFYKKWKMNAILLIVSISDICDGNWRIIRHIYINDYNVLVEIYLGGGWQFEGDFRWERKHTWDLTQKTQKVCIVKLCFIFISLIFFGDAGDCDCFRFR